MCFACGFEAGRVPAGQPAKATSASASVTVSPATPAPAAPRPGAPPAAPPAAPAARVPRAPTFAPLPPLPPLPGIPPIVVGPARAASALSPSPAPAPPAPAPLAQPSPVSPASDPARAPGVDGVEDNTVDVERPPVPPWLRSARRIYASPAVFGLAFVLGFLVMFGPGALIFLGEESAEDLYAAQRIDDVIAVLQAREAARKMKPNDWLIYGHALYRKHGILQRDAMLDKYAQAVRDKVVDRLALENSVLALSDDKSRDRAMLVLSDWPDTTVPALDADKELAATLNADNFALRHAALAALEKRKAPAQLILVATAAVALQDVKSMSCDNDAARLGLQTMKRIADGDKDEARAAFSGANPTDLLLEMDAAKRAELKCVDGRLMQATQAAVATVMRP